MKKATRNKKACERQRGIALITTLILILILSALAGALLFATQTEIWTTSNYRQLTQARYAAEAGAQKAANWLVYTYTPPASLSSSWDLTKSPVQYGGNPVVLSANSSVSSNYSDSTVQSAFNTALNGQSVAGVNANATYAVTATLVSMRPVGSFLGSGGAGYLQSWQIVSQGSITGVRNAQIQVTETIEKMGSPVFSYAVAADASGCGSVTFSGGAITDSFDSSKGSYTSTQQNSGGNVGTNGNLTLSGTKTQIYGSLSDPNSGTGGCSSSGMTALTTSGGAAVNGGTTQLSSPLVYPTPPAPTPTPPTTNQGMSGSCGGISGCTDVASKTVALAPGQYGNLSASGGTTIHLSAGTYNVNSIKLSGNSTIVLDSVPVVINVAGTGASTAIDMSGGSVSNSTGIPANFQIVYGGTGGVTLSGGSGSYGLVYAPNSPITMSGGADWYGAIIGSSVTDSGGSAVHYDRSLQNSFFMAGPYHQTAFSWNKV